MAKHGSHTKHDAFERGWRHKGRLANTGFGIDTMTAARRRPGRVRHGENSMSDNENENVGEIGRLLDSLSAEEKVMFVQALPEVARAVKSKRREVEMEELAREYRRELLAVPPGSANNSARTAIQAKYRAKGLDVGRVNLGV
jgi:hypothetical protein